MKVFIVCESFRFHGDPGCPGNPPSCSDQWRIKINTCPPNGRSQTHRETERGRSRRITRRKTGFTGSGSGRSHRHVVRVVARGAVVSGRESVDPGLSRTGV